ncbi:hypothetical protein [Marinomonas gallaica]|uniref:hypothetical protein n=1 Tax=Marinomonas gallaica TaxID=1806667 RepID=UPI003A9040C7
MLLFLSELSDEEINVVSDYWKIDDANGDFAYPISNVSKKHGYTPSKLSKLLSRSPKVGIYELDRCCPSCNEPIAFSSRSGLKKYINLVPKSLCKSCILKIVSSASSEVNDKVEQLYDEFKEGFDIQQPPYHLKLCLYLLFTKFKASEGSFYNSKRPVLSGSSWLEEKIYSDLSSMMLLVHVKGLDEKRLSFYEECIPNEFQLDENYLISNGYINSSLDFDENDFLDPFHSKGEVYTDVLSQLECAVYEKKLSVEDLKELRFFISDILVRRLSYILRKNLKRLGVEKVEKFENKNIASKIADMIDKYSIHKCTGLVFKALKKLEKYLVYKNFPHNKLQNYFLSFLNEAENNSAKIDEVVLDKNYVSYFERFFCIRVLDKEILNFNYMNLKEIMAVVANKTID